MSNEEDYPPSPAYTYNPHRLTYYDFGLSAL